MSQKNTQNNKIVIAKIMRPFKLNGLLHIEAYGELEKYDLVFENGDAVPIEYIELPRGQDPSKIPYRAFLKLDGIEDRSQAEPFVNMLIYCGKNELSKLKDGEYYYHELIGMEVYCNGEKCATVTAVNNFSGNIILDTNTPYMIEFNNSKIDIINNRIDVEYFG